MVSFFARHEKNKDSKTKSGEPGAGQIAWLLWGGNPGQRWAKKVKRQMEAADMKKKSLAELANAIITVRGKLENNPQNGGILPPDSKLGLLSVCDQAHLAKSFVILPPLTYKSETHTGAMIALFLPADVGRKFGMMGDDSLLPSEMHITLAYLGKADQLTYEQAEECHSFLSLISSGCSPLTGTINGCGRFCNGGDEGDPFFIIPDLPDLPALREAVIAGVRMFDIAPASDHGFTPHITLAYIPHNSPNPFDQIERTPVIFPTISLVLAGDRFDYPLRGGGEIMGKGLIEKIGARHTKTENELIQKIHDLALELGAECHPIVRRAGARHSHADQSMVQRIHDDCAGLGAECKALKRDKLHYSQVMKETGLTYPEILKKYFPNAKADNQEVTEDEIRHRLEFKGQLDAPNYKAASTPQRCANCKFFRGDPGEDYCTLFDFTADQDYVCDDWEAQRPDEIPGYIEGKSLAALTEGILILRGGRTSGNWGHAGRKGKRGGSGRGGGFKRIGVKPGANRKAIKRAAEKKISSKQKKVSSPKKPETKQRTKPGAKPKVEKPQKTDQNKTGDVNQAKPTTHTKMTKSHENWYKNMPENQQDALLTYTSGEFNNINGGLRGLNKLSTKNKKVVSDMDKALRPLDEDTVVFRKMGADVLEKKFGSDIKKWVGKEYSDGGYTSTSVKSKGLPFHGIDMEIRVPKGTKAGYLGSHPDNVFGKSEQELLLGRGQKFRVLKVRGGKNPKLIMEVVQ
jgi:2'-5' RNA ligase